MTWRLLLVAEQRVRKIDASHMAAAVYRGAAFEDGAKITKTNQRAAALRSPNNLLTQARGLCSLRPD